MISRSVSLALLCCLSFAGCVGPASSVDEQSGLGLSQGDEPIPQLGRRGPLLSIVPAAGIMDYRMGDEFGKKQVDAASLATASAAYRRASQATAKVGGATGFYLGQFAGVHVMATNHHVQPSMSCSGRTV